jgi:hypothetical protein
MKKTLLFSILLCSILLLSICFAQEKTNIQEYGKTIVNHTKNYEETEKDKDTKLSIDKFEAKSNERIKIEFKAKERIKQICLDFPSSTHLITVNTIYQDGFIFNTDISKKEKRINNSICYTGLDLTNDEITFNISYNSRETIKYNITTDTGINLDPYLIGNLATSNSLLLRLPFDGNSSNVWASLSVPLVAANVRYQSESDSYYYYSSGSP